MLLKLAFLFIFLPLLELYLLLKIGGAIGVWRTIGIVVLTGVLGAYLAQYEGTGVMNRMSGELAEGRVPGESLIEAVLIFAGGLLLLTPGILTDLFGFSLIFPFTRRAYRNWLKKRLELMVRRGETRITYIIH